LPLRRLPGEGLRRRARTREDLVQRRQDLLAQFQFYGPQRAVELFGRARADDRAGDAGAGEEPGQGCLAGFDAVFVEEVLVGLDLGA
jgi:hypothetical protein